MAFFFPGRVRLPVLARRSVRISPSASGRVDKASRLGRGPRSRTPATASSPRPGKMAAICDAPFRAASTESTEKPSIKPPALGRIDNGRQSVPAPDGSGTQRLRPSFWQLSGRAGGTDRARAVVATSFPTNKTRARFRTSRHKPRRGADIFQATCQPREAQSRIWQ